MNIFATHFDPLECARFLDDKRVVKMVLETAQLLSTATLLSGGTATYKVTHKNHPCSVWVRQTRSNYLWTLEHFKGLLQEYTKRFNKIHACSKFLLEYESGANNIPEGKQTSFVNCTTLKDESDVHLAYRKYLAEKWLKDKRIPTWNKRLSPSQNVVSLSSS